MKTIPLSAGPYQLTFHPLLPFHFNATLHKPDHFPSTDNAWEPGIRWQTMRWEGIPLGLKIINNGTVTQPEIVVLIWSEEELESEFIERLGSEITYRFNLDLDLHPFYHQFEQDSRLLPILERFRGMRPAHFSSLYEYLIIAIVLQNATVRRSVNMLQALYEAYGVHLIYDNRQMSCFWNPADLTAVGEDELRSLKVGYRAKSIQRVTVTFAAGQIDEFDLREKTVPEQRAALLQLYGIGPASVGYLLFGVFHHWDEMDHISPWEQKIYSKLFFDKEPDHPVPVDQLMKFFKDRFGGYRALAVHYLWEDLWWRRKNEPIEWLEKLIRL